MTTTVTFAGYDQLKPASVPTLAAGPTGLMGVGIYSYKITFVTAFGETDGSAASAGLATATGGMNLTSIPISTNGNVIGRNLYRTTSGGGSYLFLHAITDNLTTVYVDIAADGTLGTAIPLINTAPSREVGRGFVSKSHPNILATENSITAGAGGTSLVAYQLTAECSFVTVAAVSGDSVKLIGLNANMIGIHMKIKNNSANSIQIYPFNGQFIDLLAADTPVSLIAGATTEFMAISATTWSQTLSSPVPMSSFGFAMFFGNAPADYGATVAVGAALDFPHAGPTGGLTPPTRSGAGTFVFPVIGTYVVAWQAGITEAGQLMISSSATGLNAATVASRVTGTCQIANTVILVTTVINEVISIVNPPGNATALTVSPTTVALTHAPAANLTITRIA